jgi:hypothetical protein
MKSFKIESNIPYPRNQISWVDLFQKMKVGDSFSISLDRKFALSAMITYHHRKNKQRFSMLKYKNGYRCWRIK